MTLTEKSLLAMGGWQEWKLARTIHASGAVLEASYEPPMLVGRIREGGRDFRAGLKINNTIDVDNLCPCRDSRIRGIICRHSLAVGLQVIQPSETKRPSEEVKSEPRQTGEMTLDVPEVRFVIEGSLRHLEGQVDFRYSRPGVRNAAFEAGVFGRLLDVGFREEKGKPVLKGEAEIVRFFAASLPHLRKEWTVEEGQRFQNVTRNIERIEPQMTLSDTNDGWLDLHVHYTAGTEAVLSHADLSRLLRGGQGHLSLKSGRIAVPDGLLAADLDEVLRDCDPIQERGTYRIRANQRGYLEESIARWTNRSVAQAPAEEVTLGSLEKILRPYQVEGTKWLLRLARSGSAGLLADEMGLGKTVQTLAMIEQLSGTVLVVCPSSLVWNWAREAKRFLPDLSVVTIDGPDRQGRLAKAGDFRLCVTSYALLRRDVELYAGLEFAAVILDEAQHIKNPDSQNAKAACSVAASSRFILTGTPIENSVRDLWSLFEFLHPGYLGTRSDFRDRYETPLLNGERGALWDRLTRRIHPYILRRRKAEILDDLPPKIEQIIEVDLTDKQKVAYSQLQETARNQIDALAKQNSGAARMKALTALLRLRQVCCDLRLLGGDLPAEAASSKISALLELLEEVVDGGHRALVFSQFTTMLDRIGQSLEKEGISFCRLDGSTRDRQAVVDKFQGDSSIPVFLISLKAGGVGLNLTAADTVIHFDPWWNPAVEAQATDRAHRIGQTSVVTSIKLIARNTVEERVLKLQNAKRNLLAQTVDADAALEALSVTDLATLVS